MKLLVTGGAGFIGANFILYWRKTHPGDHIVNLDALTYAGNPDNLQALSTDEGYTFVRGDIRERETVRHAMRGADTVVHFAAESHVDRSIMNPSEFVETNVLGTQVLLDAALDAKVTRFHHISTDEVFGSLERDSGTRFRADTPYAPRSPYAASKAASDHLVRAYFHTYGLPVTISNCSNNFGPYQFPEKLIPLAVTNILEGRKVPVYGDGLQVRDWLYVEDHCRAIDRILADGKAGETYLIGGMTQSITNLDVVRRIATLMGRDDMVEFVKDRPGHDQRYAIDWSETEKSLGWRPQADFETYLKHTIAWYTDNRTWWERVKSGAYRAYYEKQYGKKV